MKDPIKLTEKQRAILDFIKSRRFLAPSISEIAAHFGISPTSVQFHIQALRKKGAITVTGSDPSVTDYVLEVPARCSQCGAQINEKTLV